MNGTEARKRRARRFIAVLAALLLPAAMASLALGAVPLGPRALVDGLASALRRDFSDPAAVILAQLRLPRTLLAASMGAVLALCGAVSQGLFRNPLADPSLIGVTGGATLGAAAAMVLGAGDLAALPVLTIVSLGAFAGGVAAVLLVYRLATDSSGTSVATMLLAGIAITALAGALVSLLEFYADNTLLRHISLWKMGGLETGSAQEVILALVVATGLCLALPRHGSALNALLLGESEAAHLGIRVGRLKGILVGWIALGVGVSVALAGTIAFVGLVVPHLVRLAIGPDHRYLLPGSALAGAILLLLADTAARLLAPPAEIPVGILTALVGVPFFLSLLRQRSRFGMAAA